MIPADLTPFIGRRREAKEIRRLLEGARLLTLTGPGGIGKTRLATHRAGHTARARARAFPDGVWSVPLGALTDPDLLPQVVSAAVGLPDGTGATPMQALSEHLADRRALLVLDDCEHLVEECARLVRTLLRAAAGLRVLVTSQQPLGIEGEQVFRVPPLGVPPASVDRETPDSLLGYESVGLFVSRATAAEPGFRLDGDQLVPVAELCRILEGVPLTIELAAIRLRTLSVREIVTRLDNRFRLLSIGNRGSQPRQSSLAAMVEWSYDLLDETDRRLWQRLTVFAGSVELDAAEAVCSDTELPPEAVLDRLHRLVERSIVVRDDQAGRVRYCMLDTLRQFGHSRLIKSGELAELRARHRDWCTALTSRAEAEWAGAAQLDWSHRLRAERHNIRAAVDYCLSAPAEVEAGLRMVVALRHYWLVNGVSEGRRHTERLLAALPDGATPTRASGLWLAGWLAFYQGDMAVGRRYGTEARALAESGGDAVGLAYSSYVLGLVALAEQDHAGAITLLRAAREAQRQTHDVVGEWLATADLAGALGAAGQLEAGMALCEPIIEHTAERGALWCQAYLVWVLADLKRSSGDMAGSGRLVTRLLRLTRDFDDPSLIGSPLEFLAWVADAQGEPADVAWLLGAARAAWGTADVALLRYPTWRQAHDTRAALGEDRFNTSYLVGRRLTRKVASVRGGRPGERGPHERHSLVHQACPVGQFSLVGAELVRVVPGAEAQGQPASGQDVEQPGLLRQPAWLGQREQCDPGAEPDRAGLPGEGGERGQRGRQVPVVDPVLFTGPHRAVAEALGGAHQLDHPVVMLRGGRRAGRRPHVGAEAVSDHRMASYVAAIPSRPFPAAIARRTSARKNSGISTLMPPRREHPWPVPGCRCSTAPADARPAGRPPAPGSGSWPGSR